MKKILTSALAIFAISVAANAQGTWYTDQSKWLSNLTSSVTTADYISRNGVGFFTSPYTENGVMASASAGFWGVALPALSTNSQLETIKFTFSGNAFAGLFGMTNVDGALISDGMNFSVDGSATNAYSLTSTTGYTFLGYISDSASDISVLVNGDATPEYVTVDSFSFANGTNPAAPGGAVPEPGTVVSMGLLGAGVLGLVVRSRRRISN